MVDTHLTIIQELITENQTYKYQNNKIIRVVQDLLTGIVELFQYFFPGIKQYDSDNIYSASQNILNYYNKQLMLVKAEINMNLLQIFNVYGIENEMDNLQQNIFSFNSFCNIMKAGKSSIKNELEELTEQIQRLSLTNSSIQRQNNNKQLIIEKMKNEMNLKETDIDSLRHEIELLGIDKRSLLQKLERVNYDYQAKNSYVEGVENQIDQLKIQNESLMRQVIALEAEKVSRAFPYQ